MLVTDIGYALAGLTAVGIIFIGARFLLAPSAAAAGFEIAAWHDGGKADPYLSVKGVRDIASGLIAGEAILGLLWAALQFAPAWARPQFFDHPSYLAGLVVMLGLAALMIRLPLTSASDPNESASMAWAFSRCRYHSIAVAAPSATKPSAVRSRARRSSRTKA